MTKPKNGLVPAGRRYGVRKNWRTLFLAALAETSNVTAAAEAAAISLSCVYRTKREDREFARQWLVALAEGYDSLEMELLQRLRNGTSGQDADRKFDNATALRLLAAHRDSAARQQAIRDNADTDTIVQSINETLEQMRQRSIELGEYVPEAPAHVDADAGK